LRTAVEVTTLEVTGAWEVVEAVAEAEEGIDQRRVHDDRLVLSAP
jgi:hypothetical protein